MGLAPAWLLACGGAPSGGQAPADTEPEVISCEPWHREPISGTETVLVNNVWNEQWADGQPYEQCLLRRARDQQPQYGWRWQWPAYKPYSSYAAPEVMFGWKAWDGGSSTSPSLPRRIDALDALTVDFAADVQAEATHNLNTTMWVTATDVATAERNPADIRNEIMVWFSNPAGLGGGIPYDGEVTLDGVTFDVWHLVNHPDGSGGTTHTWTMIVYISRAQVLDTTFDLKLVLDDSVSKGLVDPTHAVGGVELITEVFGGSGELWLERFDVSVQPP